MPLVRHVVQYKDASSVLYYAPIPPQIFAIVRFNSIKSLFSKLTTHSAANVCLAV